MFAPWLPRRYALSAGVAMNLDNPQELGRVADLVREEPGLLAPGARLGLRINPQVSDTCTSRLGNDTDYRSESF
jgi:diaminopimelate decarboxylase